jgi:hypothetical protein
MVVQIGFDLASFDELPIKPEVISCNGTSKIYLIDTEYTGSPLIPPTFLEDREYIKRAKAYIEQMKLEEQEW